MEKRNVQLLLLTILVAGLPACNKDGLITGEEFGSTVSGQPGEPDSGITPPELSLQVFRYLPAPGQFINETTGRITAEEAAEWACERLRKGEYVSLGAFGGYIDIGFGVSIGDFIITGNAFDNDAGSSNEPGVVYVMQDSNGNGLPDDTWFELRGSEFSNQSVVRKLSVTYYRPEKTGSSVRWRADNGLEGEIDYLSPFHTQDSYYPEWVDSDSYTLTGCCLPNTSVKDENGFWRLPPFEWGYADNTGSNENVFHLSDAVDENGEDVELSYIDFIRVQTGVIGKCGALGEISTEVVSIVPLSLLK